MRRDARAASQEALWVTGLKRALLRAGVTVDKIAGAIAGALDAERMAAGADGEAVNLGPHHSLRLKAVSLLTEIYAPRRTGQSDARPILNVQAGAKVQLVFFGEAITPLPERETAAPSLPTQGPAEMSAELKTHLVRSGRLLPDGMAPADAKATEATKAPPEAKGRERGEGWS